MLGSSCFKVLCLRRADTDRAIVRQALSPCLGPPAAVRSLLVTRTLKVHRAQAPYVHGVQAPYVHFRPPCKRPFCTVYKTFTTSMSSRTYMGAHYTHTHAFTHTRAHVRTHMHMLSHKHTHTHKYTHTRANLHTHTRARARTHARTHTRTHTHTQTHICNFKNVLKFCVLRRWRYEDETADHSASL